MLCERVFSQKQVLHCYIETLGLTKSETIIECDSVFSVYLHIFSCMTVFALQDDCGKDSKKVFALNNKIDKKLM